MSDTEQESMSERELADWMTDTVYSDSPRSVGEALAAADETAEPQAPAADEEPVAEPPVVVEDAPTDRDTEPDISEGGLDAGLELEPEAEDEDLDIEDENVVWATKKYGDDPTKWAQAARAQEQHISRLAAEKKEAEELAGEWYSYAQEIEQRAQQQTQMGMPLSTQEEMWVEQAASNPYQYAKQAAMQGNVPLYQAVIGRVAEDNPILAGQVGAQVQMEMQQMAQAEQNGVLPQPTLQQSLGESIGRLGIDLSVYGEPMSAKVGELGEYHPYVQAIMEGDPNSRDIALLAVYDLVRTTAMSTRKVRSVERDEQIKHEAELRRQASGVVTGGPINQQPPAQSPFMDAMEEEWRQRGQWSEE